MSRLLQWLRDLVRALIDLLRGLLGDDTCPIAWRPNALAPVFYAYRDYGTTDGAAAGAGASAWTGGGGGAAAASCC
jgi:hypothetical protein